MTFPRSLLSIFPGSLSSTLLSPVFSTSLTPTHVFTSLCSDPLHLINALSQVVLSNQSYCSLISCKNTSNLPHSLSWRGKLGRKLLRREDGDSGEFCCPLFHPPPPLPTPPPHVPFSPNSSLSPFVPPPVLPFLLL